MCKGLLWASCESYGAEPGKGISIANCESYSAEPQEVVGGVLQC